MSKVTASALSRINDNLRYWVQVHNDLPSPDGLDRIALANVERVLVDATTTPPSWPNVSGTFDVAKCLTLWSEQFGGVLLATVPIHPSCWVDWTPGSTFCLEEKPIQVTAA